MVRLLTRHKTLWRIFELGVFLVLLMLQMKHLLIGKYLGKFSINPLKCQSGMYSTFDLKSTFCYFKDLFVILKIVTFDHFEIKVKVYPTGHLHDRITGLDT